MSEMFAHMNAVKLHAFFVHFPIALVFAGFFAVFLWLLTKKESFKTSAIYCIILAGLLAIPSVLTGLAAAGQEEFDEKSLAILARHRLSGIALAAVSILVILILLFKYDRLKGWWLVLFCLLMIALLICTGIAGYFGGMLVHGIE